MEHLIINLNSPRELKESNIRIDCIKSFKTLPYNLVFLNEQLNGDVSFAHVPRFTTILL